MTEPKQHTVRVLLKILIFPFYVSVHSIVLFEDFMSNSDDLIGAITNSWIHVYNVNTI